MSRRERDADEMAAFMLRVSKGMVRRASTGDVAAVVALRDIDRQVKVLLGDAARAWKGSSADTTWETLAQELGVTKQAVIKRWSEGDEDE